MEAGQMVLSDKKTKDLSRNAKGANFDSHTQRYQQCLFYRNTCDLNNITEWLKGRMERGRQ